MSKKTITWDTGVKYTYDAIDGYYPTGIYHQRPDYKPTIYENFSYSKEWPLCRKMEYLCHGRYVDDKSIDWVNFTICPALEEKLLIVQAKINHFKYLGIEYSSEFLEYRGTITAIMESNTFSVKLTEIEIFKKALTKFQKEFNKELWSKK